MVGGGGNVVDVAGAGGAVTAGDVDEGPTDEVAAEVARGAAVDIRDASDAPARCPHAARASNAASSTGGRRRARAMPPSLPATAGAGA